MRILKPVPLSYYKKAKETLDYNPKTGIFRWKVHGRGIRYGHEAGNIGFYGYRQIRVCGQLLVASRIAWYIMEGYVPENEIDHKNRIRDDNRWKNLRHVSRSCNSRNSSIRSDNKSGVPGVRWHKARKKWIVYIRVGNKQLYLGYFKNKANAVYTRWKSEVEHGFPDCNINSLSKQWLDSNVPTNFTVTV